MIKRDIENMDLNPVTMTKRDTEDSGYARMIIPEEMSQKINTLESDGDWSPVQKVIHWFGRIC